MLWKMSDSQLPGFQDGRGLSGPGQQVTGKRCPGPARVHWARVPARDRGSVAETPRACGKAGSEPGFPAGSKRLTTRKPLLVIHGQRQSTNQVAVACPPAEPGRRRGSVLPQRLPPDG